MLHLSPKFKLRSMILAVLITTNAVHLARAQSSVRSELLPALVAEVAAQFQLAYRFQPTEVQYRSEQLNAVIAAWRVSPTSNANDERLNNWLRAAIWSSMPGSREKLPPAPVFLGSVKRQQHASTTSATPASAQLRARTLQLSPAIPSAELDPFRDDATGKRESKK